MRFRLYSIRILQPKMYYPGNKNIPGLIHKIINQIPDCSYFLEPFAGSAAVSMFLSVLPGIKTQFYINDLDPLVISNCRVPSGSTVTNIDGFDITPLLTGNNIDLHHDTLFWETGHEGAVRTGKWKYHTARNDPHAQNEMVELEIGEFLINLEEDLGETTNLKDEYPEVFEQLKEAHRRWREKMPSL